MEGAPAETMTDESIESIGEVAIDDKDKLNPSTLYTLDEVNNKTVEELFQTGNIEELLKNPDGDAQLAATVLVTDRGSHFNVRNPDRTKWLSTANLEEVAKKLSLDQDTYKFMVDKRNEYVHNFLELQQVGKDRENFEKDNGYMLGYSWGRNEENDKQCRGFIDQERSIEHKVNIIFREMMLPFREAILKSDTVSESYKAKVIEGIDYDDILPSENTLLKNLYPSLSMPLRRKVIDTVMFNIGHDLNSFDVVPMDELTTNGVDKDSLLIAILGNRQTTGEFVQSTVAPIFFPDRPPELVRECWKSLKKVTGPSHVEGESFGHDTRFMNIEVFSSFMDNAPSLIPIVEFLSQYDFQYVPLDPLKGVLNTEYIQRLIEFGQDLPKLKEELDVIRSVIPDFKYHIDVLSEYHFTQGGYMEVVKYNPFANALKKKVYPDSIQTIQQLDQSIDLFNQLSKHVPQKWREEFLSTYIANMSSVANFIDRDPQIAVNAMKEANKYALDYSLTTNQIEMFATDYFRASLDPRSENAEGIFHFCEQHAGKFTTFLGWEKHVDANATWYMFSLKASDLFRYPFSLDDETQQIAKTKADLMLARLAVFKITDPHYRDLAIKNLIYALTDQDIGDIEVAQIFIDMLEDETIKAEAEEELSLENERIQRNETTTWKKMEKVRRNSSKNADTLKALFGFSTSEKKQAAWEQYQENKAVVEYHDLVEDGEIKLEAEIDRMGNDISVTVNMPWDNVMETINKGKVLSAWENKKTMESRNTHYETLRDNIERSIGNRAKGSRNDPHPIYGAAASPNGRDEFFGGTGGSYGECFITLKTESIKDRTSFCFDDSFNIFNNSMLDWSGGTIAKAIHNLEGVISTHGYVEAQILGGIDPSMFASINIPRDAINNENIGASFEKDIEEIKSKYPDIIINIIDTPKT